MNELHLHTQPKVDRRFWSAWRKANYEYVQNALVDLPSESVLYDLGAGSVPFRDILFRFKYIGVDFVPFPDVSIVADLTQLPIVDESADVITILNTIEHVSDTELLLKETYRILKRGGIMIGTVPFLMQVHQEPHDYNRYTSHQLKHVLSNAGFVDITILPLGNLIDVYDSAEVKFFSHVPGIQGKFVRIVRRLSMRLVRLLLSQLPSNAQYTEGYGFTARRPQQR